MTHSESPGGLGNQPPQPGKLRSLWDMLNFEAKRFHELMGTLALIRALQPAEVQPTNALAPAERPDIAKGYRGAVAETLRRAADVIKPLETALTEKAINRLRERLESDSRVAPHELHQALEDIDQRLVDELEDSVVLVIQRNDGAYFDPKEPPFGSVAMDAFPLVAEDLGEAGKCFALGRYTAAVFHIMRVLERTVHQLADSVSATVEDKNGKTLVWGIILANIKGKIDSMADHREKVRWMDAHTLLHAVSVAWRNETMHPKQTYTKEEAKEIWDASRSFVRRLASLISATS